MREDGGPRVRLTHVADLGAWAKKWKDWYIVPAAWLSVIGHAPLVQFLRDGTPIAHRSHLPLVGYCAPLQPVRAGADIDVETQRHGWQLRGYQHGGVAFIAQRRGVLLADQMRLGKTPICVASHDPQSGPLVVVGPLRVRHVWRQWIARRWPGELLFEVEGIYYSGEELHRAEAIFIHYEILPAWQSMGGIRPGTLVFDEIQALSNPNSLRTQAALMMSSRAEKVIGASGTPLWNKPAGLFGILACLNPGAWGNWYDFAKRYCSATLSPYGIVTGGPSNVDEFRSRLTEVMIRREWEDVADELPVTARDIVTVELDETEKRDIDFEAAALRRTEDATTTVGQLARLRRVLGVRGKVLRAAQVAREALYGRDESVVVWAWHRDVAEALIHEIGRHNCFLLHGETPNKDAVLTSWQEYSGPAALVLTIAVGQVGIDLSKAREAVFAELDFTPATIGQAEMRTFSPDRAMKITYVVTDHWVEQKIVASLGEKLRAANLMGVPAADAAIDELGEAFGGAGVGDLDRLRRTIISEIE